MVKTSVTVIAGDSANVKKPSLQLSARDLRLNHRLKVALHGSWKAWPLELVR